MQTVEKHFRSKVSLDKADNIRMIKILAEDTPEWIHCFIRNEIINLDTLPLGERLLFNKNITIKQIEVGTVVSTTSPLNRYFWRRNAPCSFHGRLATSS